MQFGKMIVSVGLGMLLATAAQAQYPAQLPPDLLNTRQAIPAQPALPPAAMQAGGAGAYAPASYHGGGCSCPGCRAGGVQQVSYQAPPTPQYLQQAVSENVPQDSSDDILRRAASWQPFERIDSRYAPEFYRRADPSALPPASVLQGNARPGFVPEVRTKTTWRDQLSRYAFFPFF